MSSGAKEGEGDHDECMVKIATRAMAMTARARVERAVKHRLAHLISVLRNTHNSSALSASDFVGSQFSGGVRGHSIIKMPTSQKNGNTAK